MRRRDVIEQQRSTCACARVRPDGDVDVGDAPDALVRLLEGDVAKVGGAARGEFVVLHEDSRLQERVQLRAHGDPPRVTGRHA